MTTITKEWLQNTIAEFENTRDDIPFGLDEDDAKILEVLKRSLASMDSAQEPVAWLWRWSDDAEGFWRYSDERKETKGSVTVKPLYAAPQPLTDTERAELQEYRKAANAAVAWLWSHRKHKSEVTLTRPEDDDRAESALWSGWTCQALAPVRPAPVVPEDIPDSVFEILVLACGGKAWVFEKELWNACRAAMLQGGENESR